MRDHPKNASGFYWTQKHSLHKTQKTFKILWNSSGFHKNERSKDQTISTKVRELKLNKIIFKSLENMKYPFYIYFCVVIV